MIYEQYRDTTVERLALNITKLFEDLVIGAVNSFEESIYNINTAAGIGLDIWGKLLSFPRFITDPDNTSKYIELSDEQYRVILRIVAFQTASEPTIQNINRNMRQLFSGTLGADAYVVDNRDMAFITYVFSDKIPPWLKSVFEIYDILPRPMGVGINITENIVNILGFEGQDTPDKSITNFSNVIFGSN